jgi:hypothetical protein
MSYIGNTSTTQAFTPAVDFFNGNGSTTAFTLSRPVASVAQVQAVISNVPQKPGDAFTVSGNTITFTSAPPSGTQNIYVYYTSPITQVIAPGQGTVGTAQIQNGAVIPADLSTGAPTWNTSGNIASANTTIGATNLTLRANGNGYTTGALALQDAAGTSKNYITAISGTVYIGDNSSNDCATVNQYGVGLGNTTPSSGVGVKFPATQSASSDANTLDDYEEGTFTPNQGSGLTVSGSFSSTGRYIKIGRLVYVEGTLVGSVSIASSAASILFTNLPFTGQSGMASGLGGMTNNSINVSNSCWVSAGGSGLYGAATLSASAAIWFSVTYQTTA